jgi:hypothetical protein
MHHFHKAQPVLSPPPLQLQTQSAIPSPNSNSTGKTENQNRKQKSRTNRNEKLMRKVDEKKERNPSMPSHASPRREQPSHRRLLHRRREAPPPQITSSKSLAVAPVLPLIDGAASKLPSLRVPLRRRLNPKAQSSSTINLSYMMQETGAAQANKRNQKSGKRK